MDTEHRRASRLDLSRRLDGEVVGAGEGVRVREISETGMQIETRAALAPLSTHDFQLNLHDGEVVRVSGRVRHGRFDVRPGGVVYRLGIEFVEVPEASRAALHRLLLALQRDPLPFA